MDLKRRGLTVFLKSDTVHGPALVRDFLELIQRNQTQWAETLPTLEELGLKIIGTSYGNKKDLIEKHLEWKSTLQDPQNGIPALIHSGDFGTQTPYREGRPNSASESCRVHIFATSLHGMDRRIQLSSFVTPVSLY